MLTYDYTSWRVSKAEMRHLHSAQMLILEQSILAVSSLESDTKLVGVFVGAGSSLIHDNAGTGQMQCS